jgi:hypothetical protein
MIIKGNPRRDVDFWAAHLMRTDQNERVALVDIRGLSGESVRDCLAELDAIAQGTRTKNGFYVASLNPRDDETLTNEQWTTAADRLEENLGLAGQPRFIVEHEKEGRTHRHVVWGRIDADTMKAIPADFNFARHEQTSRELEQLFGLEPVIVEPRAERGPKDWETFRAQDSGIDPKEMALEITALWQGADSGLAFKAALEDAGYILARGDRRDFVIIDQAGDDHSITRRTGAKAAEVRARLADIDRDALPSVAEARELARDAADAASSAAPEAAPSGELPPLASGAEVAFSPLASAAPADLPPLEPATAPDTSEEHTGWRRFADRVRGLASKAAELLHDESSGGENGHGVVQRVLSMGRKVVGGWHHHNAQELNEGLAEGADIAADELAKKAANTPTSSPKTWVERVLAEGLHKARDILHNERGSGPGLGISNPQSDFERLAEEWAAGVDAGSDSGPEPPGIDAHHESDTPQPDGPDADDWDITP